MPAILAIVGRVLAYWKPILGLATLLGVFWAGYSMSSTACAEKRQSALIEALEQQREDFAKKQGRSDAVGQKLEAQIAEYRKAIQTLDRQLKDEIKNNTQYSTCKPTPAGLRAINSAIRARQGITAR